jgi:hypothetical protein
VPSYLVESYLACSDADKRRACERRARGAAEKLTRQGASVRFRRVIHVPEDELCFFVFDAPSALDAERAAQVAGLGTLRVVEAISSGEEHD